MVKKTLFFIVIILILVFVLFILIQLNKNAPQSIIKNLDLKNRLTIEGKIMGFKANYLGFFGMGEAELRNKGDDSYQGKQIYHLEAKANVSKLLSIFFNAQARVDSYIDKNKLHSLRFSQTLILPEKPRDEKEILYDQDNNIMELRGIKRQILPHTQDPLSAMFYIQHQNFELGKEFDININTNQNNYRLSAKVIKKEEYVIEDKNIGIWVVSGEVRRRDKSPRHSLAITLWLLNNPSKTIILVKVITNIGPITLRLISIE
jgi:hypothetical protein